MDVSPQARFTPGTFSLVRRFSFRSAAVTAMTAVILSLGLAGCADRGSRQGTEISTANVNVATRLAPGDVIRLTFRKLPELNQTQKIRGDGRVNLLQVGTIKAAGKTLDSFQSELATRYELTAAKDLNVTLESTSTAVYVAGAVTKPGKVIIDRPMTLLEVIMESGGFNRETANLKKVSLTRLVNGKYVTRNFDMRDPSAGVVYVQPYDMIEVPRFFY